MTRRLLQLVVLLPLLLSSGQLHAGTVSATARLSVGGLETQAGGGWDSGSLTVSFNGFSETVHYAQFSTPESLAAGLAAMFVRDYRQYGLYAKAGGLNTSLNVITLQLTNGQQFGCVVDAGPTSSFTLSASGFASNCSPATDSGTVTLSVNGSVVSTTRYGAGSTPTTIADGLASQASSGVVTVKADGSLVYVTSTMQGSGTDYPYALSVVDDTAGVTPTVSATPSGGSLTGGSNGGPRGTPGTVYSYGITYDAASNVQTLTDSVMGNWTYGYDTLNRLTSGVASSGAYVTSQTPYLCWSYDDYGNRLHQTLSSAALANGTTCQGGGGTTVQDTSVTYLANNRIAGSTLPGVSGTVTPSYDAAGNVTNDGVNTTYLYDAEGRVCAVHGVYGMTGYQYDASGVRVGKGTITSMSCDVTANGYVPTNDYVLGQGSEQVTEVAIQNGVPFWQHTNVMADGMLVATYDTAGLHFYLNDALGSRRAQTDAAGQWEQNCLSLPYGDQLSCTMSVSAPTEHHFTGKERDAESGLDYFGARYYASNMGRFMSPDWSAKQEPVPYSKLDNPQTLNLYNYMRNNPLGGTDPDGHCCEEEDPEEEMREEPLSATVSRISRAVHTEEFNEREQRINPGASPASPEQVEAAEADGRAKVHEFLHPNGDMLDNINSKEPLGPYKRPNNATTPEQRDSVQGKPCATCGATGQKNNADHKDPLVEQHYRGGIDKDKMRSPEAVRPQCASCSAQQGGYLKQFSTAMKKLFGFN